MTRTPASAPLYSTNSARTGGGYGANHGAPGRVPLDGSRRVDERPTAAARARRRHARNAHEHRHPASSERTVFGNCADRMDEVPRRRHHTIHPEPPADCARQPGPRVPGTNDVRSSGKPDRVARLENG